MGVLKTNYVDDQLDVSKNTKRKYNVIKNSDGTESLEDVTEYTTKGDRYGAVDINSTNAEVNEINEKLGITKAMLEAGNTSITIADRRITVSSALSFYTSIYGINPETVSVDNGSVTLTFKEQDTDMEVGVRVDE